MVEDTLSQEREHARVPRNHLPQLIHPGTRSVEKRADSAPAVQAVYPAAHGTLGLADSPEVRSSMPSPFAKDLQKLKTAPFPVIGRAICSAGPRTVTSQRWWNDIRVLPSWSKYPAKTPRRSSPR